MNADPGVGYSLAAWMSAAPIAVFTFGMMVTSRVAIRRHLKKARASLRTEFAGVPAGVFIRAALAFLMLLSLGAGSRMLVTGTASESAIGAALTIVLFYRAGAWTTAATAWLDHRRRRRTGKGLAVPGSPRIIGLLLNVIVWTIGLLLTLDDPGMNGFAQAGVGMACPMRRILFDAPSAVALPSTDVAAGVPSLIHHA